MAQSRIIVGGWTKYAEDTGVNKKESFEDFSWITTRDKYRYEGCRDCLTKMDGSRDWLKVNTFSPGSSCEMSNKINSEVAQLDGDYNVIGLLKQYKSLLNDWDTWVYLVKRSVALKEYKSKQVSLSTVNRILERCSERLKEGDTRRGNDLDFEIKFDCALLELTGSVVEIRETLTYLQAELQVLQAEEEVSRAQAIYNNLMCNLEHLYESPIRWFDTPQGSTLLPRHPEHMGTRALNEMEAKYPGYKAHINLVTTALNKFTWPKFGTFSKQGQEVLSAFLIESGIKV